MSNSTAQTSLKSLPNKASAENIKNDVFPLKNYVNIPLVLLGYKEVAASEKYQKVGNETYYILDCMPLDEYPSSDEDYKPLKLSCGAWKIIEQIKLLNAVEDLPMQFTPKIDGKTLYME